MTSGSSDGVSSAGELAAAPPAQPPYDIVRSAWAELVVLDLAEAERYYVDVLGLIVSERGPGALYLRGWEERLHHSLVLREGPVAGLERLAFRVRTEADLDALAADFAARGCETASSDGEHPGIGRALHVRDPVRLPAGLLPRDEPVRHAAAALRPAARRAGRAHRPLQPPRHGRRGQLPLLAVARLPLHRVHLDRRARRADHGCLARAQADRARRRADGRRRPAPAPPRLRRPRHRRACCARATRSPRPATPRASSAAPGGTASRTPSSSTSATRRAIASSSTHATTTPAIPTTSRCAGRPRMRAAARSGARARPTAGTTNRPSCSGRRRAGPGDRRRRGRARLVPRRRGAARVRTKKTSRSAAAIRRSPMLEELGLA